ncbi:MAG: hypothetical protein J6K17_00195 [Oscillospiraceae bacterium]|nr:hypothetical protein [Oscillospiraceae bacterium]
MAYQQPQYYQGGYYPQYNNGATPDMLNQYKAQYQQIPMQQPMMQQPVQQMPIQTMAQPAPSNDMIFVLNEAEATSYPVAPNNSVILWDKNNDVVYIKSVNAQNIPSFRVLDYKERTADNAPKTPVEHKCTCGDKFVLKKDFQALQSEFEAMREELEELKAKPKAKTTKIVKTEDENDG